VLELAPDNIRVNTLCPGWADTPFSDDAIALSEDPAATQITVGESNALDRMAHPDDVAQAAKFLASKASSFVTGAPLFVDGGFMIKK
jgi:dihydroanticapsin dehydrogenase